mmetsp:Transcript_20812/g.36729  ORF Transcript_20812/g.36729 Transcript_20812/m.36729 type:complete len:100 (-) Transcript_20812:267-566(-)
MSCIKRLMLRVKDWLWSTDEAPASRSEDVELLALRPLLESLVPPEAEKPSRLKCGTARVRCKECARTGDAGLLPEACVPEALAGLRTTSSVAAPDSRLC